MATLYSTSSQVPSPPIVASIITSLVFPSRLAASSYIPNAPSLLTLSHARRELLSIYIDAMSSVVAEFIVRPVLRQVRRFSRSGPTHDSHLPCPAQTSLKDQSPSRDDSILEAEEHSDMRHVVNDVVSSAPAPSRSRSPLIVGDGRVPDSFARTQSAVSHDVLAQQASWRQGSTDNVSSLFGRAVEAREDTRRPSEPGSSSMPNSDGPGVDASPVVAADRSDALPEDDGMGDLRRRIQEIHAQIVAPADRARLIHSLLMEGYTRSRATVQSGAPGAPIAPPSAASTVDWEQTQAQGALGSFKFWHIQLGEAPAKKFVLSAEDVKATFAPLKPDEEESEYRALGCEHYRRNVKLQCSICSHWHTCRFCHDAVEDHTLIAKETKNMLCMFCGTAQKAGEVCVSCDESAAQYYCHICKLWDNDADKNIYHCNDCGICRIGRGLGKDYFHCKRCCACLAMSIKDDHRCIERSVDCDCPICGEYMFNSRRRVWLMKCGHSIHMDCFQQHIVNFYKCPICNRSVTNMETHFRNLEAAIQNQPMPDTFRDTRAVVLCNDCSAKTTVKYHWLGLKCAVCLSFNTSQLRILGVAGAAPDLSAGNEASSSRQPDPSGPGIQHAGPLTAPRAILSRRRHSSNVMHLGPENLDPRLPAIGSYVIQDRLARSVSPSTAVTLAPPTVANKAPEAEESDDGEDMIGLWGRVPRSRSPNEEQHHAPESEEESESSSSADEAEEDDDEDDEDEHGISLFGHR